MTADWSLTFIVGDPTTHMDGIRSSDRHVTLMRKPEELENQFEVGRAVLFRNLKVKRLYACVLTSDQPLSRST